MEGAVLKRKFDDIFDSTRYVKALEEIKDQKKIYNNKVRDLKADLNLLKGHKHAAGGFRNELDECRQKLSDVVDEMNDFNAKIQEERSNLKAWGDQLAAVDKIQGLMDDLLTRFDNENIRIAMQKSTLQQDYTETKTKDELETVIKGFERNMESDVRELQAANERIARIESRIETLKQKQVQKAGERGMIMGEKKIYDVNLQKRIELMEELATKYGLELTFSQTQPTQGMNTQQSRFSTGSNTTADDGTSVFTSGTMGTASTIQITTEDLDAFHRSVDMKLQELKEQLKEHRARSESGEDAIQKELNELSAKVKSAENGKRAND